MNACAPEASRGEVTMEFLVRDHPGVLARMCGFFMRRGYPVRTLFTIPSGDGKLRLIRVDFEAGVRLSRLTAQVSELPDVARVAGGRELSP